MSEPFTVACVQMTSGRDVAPNVEAAGRLIRQAAAEGADLVLTPETTTMMEPEPARLMEKATAGTERAATAEFARLAAELGVWLLIGSMAVPAGAGADGRPRAANRSLLLDPEGRTVARYDKIHMFDVAVPDGQTYRESATFRPGAAAVTADLPWGRLGLTVCYDVRFPGLYRQLAQAGADFISVPSAFTEFTGRAHWHVLLRARAIETGCFVFAPAQCGGHAGGRRTYGHSLVVAPWGEVLAEAGTEPGVVTARIDPARVETARGMVPSLGHDRAYEAPSGASR